MESSRDINKVIEAVKTKFPNVGVWQLEVKNPHDDNGIWYFWLGESTDDEIHVENSFGNCPFYMETYRTCLQLNYQAILRNIKRMAHILILVSLVTN